MAAVSTSLTLTIVVTDRPAKKQKEFLCDAALLRKEMGYFQPMVDTLVARNATAVSEQKIASNSDAAEVVSTPPPQQTKISVNCDLGVFEWLFQWMQSRKDNDTSKKKSSRSLNDGGDDGTLQQQPDLTVNNVVSVLMASEFLLMRRLVKEGAQFVAENLLGVLTSDVNMSCVPESLCKGIAKNMTFEGFANVVLRVDPPNKQSGKRKVDGLSLSSPKAMEPVRIAPINRRFITRLMLLHMRHLLYGGASPSAPTTSSSTLVAWPVETLAFCRQCGALYDNSGRRTTTVDTLIAGGGNAVTTCLAEGCQSRDAVTALRSVNARGGIDSGHIKSTTADVPLEMQQLLQPAVASSGALEETDSTSNIAFPKACFDETCYWALVGSLVTARCKHCNETFAIGRAAGACGVIPNRCHEPIVVASIPSGSSSPPVEGVASLIELFTSSQQSPSASKNISPTSSTPPPSSPLQQHRFTYRPRFIADARDKSMATRTASDPGMSVGSREPRAIGVNYKAIAETQATNDAPLPSQLTVDVQRMTERAKVAQLMRRVTTLRQIPMDHTAVTSGTHAFPTSSGGKLTKTSLPQRRL